MKQSAIPLMPHARKDGLVVKELPGELLVYDLERHKAHCLNDTASFIWRRCDGRTSVSELAALLASYTNAPADEQVVWFALNQLSQDRLLTEPLRQPSGARRLSRRDVIQRLGVAAAVPLVASIVAPNVYAAASCTQGCVLPTDCTVLGCQGGCTGSVCQPG
jgi:hypothetical protein